MTRCIFWHREHGGGEPATFNLQPATPSSALYFRGECGHCRLDVHASYRSGGWRVVVGAGRVLDGTARPDRIAKQVRGRAEAPATGTVCPGPELEFQQSGAADCGAEVCA